MEFGVPKSVAGTLSTQFIRMGDRAQNNIIILPPSDFTAVFWAKPSRGHDLRASRCLASVAVGVSVFGVLSHRAPCVYLSVGHLSNADDDIQNGVEVLVQQTVHHLETRMKKLGRNNVVQIARLCANAAALCGALPALEHRFATLSSRRILNTTILQDGRARFGDLVAFGEGLVTATFAQKVAEYTDMLSPSLWAPYTKAHSPYNFMAYLVQYLHSAFSELDTILSPEHARRLKTDGFQHIAKVCMGLLQTMLTPPTASGEAVANFKKDMQLVRQFAAAQGDEFVGCFEALAQRLEGVLDEVVPATAAQQPRARASGERKRRRHQWLMPWRTVGSHP